VTCVLSHEREREIEREREGSAIVEKRNFKLGHCEWDKMANSRNVKFGWSSFFRAQSYKTFRHLFRPWLCQVNGIRCLNKCLRFYNIGSVLTSFLTEPNLAKDNNFKSSQNTCRMSLKQ